MSRRIQALRWHGSSCTRSTNAFAQMIVTQMLSKHRILTPSGRHAMDVVKIRRPSSLLNAKSISFVAALDDVLTECRKFRADVGIGQQLRARASVRDVGRDASHCVRLGCDRDHEARPAGVGRSSGIWVQSIFSRPHALRPDALPQCGGISD